MRAFLLALFALVGNPLAAAEWQSFHHDPQGGLDLFIDLDTLRQTANGFESELRLWRSIGRQEFRGRQAIDCRRKHYRLSEMREVLAEQQVGELAPEERGEIADNTAQSSLLDIYCVRWQEPAGVRWLAYAQTPGETHYFDQRAESASRRQKPANERLLQVKTRGDKISMLMEVRLFCQENRFAIVNGVYRDEARGWLARIPPRDPQTPGPDSAISLLRTRLCPNPGATPAR